jgi:DNA-binding beta-propeller fold protein YncE
MPSTQIAAGRAFIYVNNIGRISRSALGFRHPVGLARGKGDVLYVANWGDEPAPNARITKCILGTQEWIADLGKAGAGEDEFLWPGGLAADSQENLYITDQSADRVISYDKDGKFRGHWGNHGSEDGQLHGPSGLAFDADENLFVVDTRNHRVQKLTKDGKFLGAFGSKGSGPGQFNMPWGVAVDKDGDVYVADWGNSRMQKLTAQGQHLHTFGRFGHADGELDHPSDVAVDKDGDVYVADWGNNRVVVYEPDGTYLATLVGDASNLSAWAQASVDSNPDLAKARARVDLEPEWRLRRPAAVYVGDDYKIIIAEAQHMRVQIYEKDPAYFEAQFTL